MTVLSRNLYVGPDVDAVILALTTPDPFDDGPALLGAIGTLQQTDFPARARAFAEEIARDRPQLAQPGPLWASDHAGIVARVLSPVAQGASTF